MALMSSSRIYTFEFTCDGPCKKKVRVESRGNYASRPDGWHHVRSSGWGMTDYTRDEDWCPECFAKNNEHSP